MACLLIRNQNQNKKLDFDFSQFNFSSPDYILVNMHGKCCRTLHSNSKPHSTVTVTFDCNLLQTVNSFLVYNIIKWLDPNKLRLLASGLLHRSSILKQVTFSIFLSYYFLIFGLFCGQIALKQAAPCCTP